MHLPLAYIAFYSITAGLFGKSAYADIVWHQPSEPVRMQTLTGKTYNFDVDFNGSADFSFRSNGATFWIEQFGDNGVLGHGVQPPDAGVDVANLGGGYVVGILPSEGLSWSTAPDWGSFSSCMSPGCIGSWLPPFDKGYFGVRFDIQGSTHFGWVYLDNNFSFLGGGDIIEWAYESEPGLPIVAGLIPESSTGALFAVGIVILRALKSKLTLESVR